MADFDLFNQETNDVDEVQLQLPVVIDVPQEEQEDKRKGVQHTVVFPVQETIPPETDDVFCLPPPQTLARSFPFQLDPFQMKAVSALERGENVLVSAHTSAGKTVVAEYAVALCLKRNQRIVYTSPIKALSNQKYRDWQESAAGLLSPGSLNSKNQSETPQIPTIGLLTGDTTINRDAQILVMTTEVLRNMLQSSSELLRELGCVVFDEVHYMRNAERGVVWEDCISLLDKRVSLALLSATLPNAPEFASWIAQTRNKITHVIYTEYRPVPLGFYVAPLLAKAQFQLFTSDNKTLNQENFTKAIQSLPMHQNQRNSENQGEKRNIRGNKAQVQETVLNVLEILGTKGLSPIIVFSFGKLRCEELAEQCRRNYRLKSLFSSPAAKQAALEIFDAALLQLPEGDRSIEQIRRSRELLGDGIAVHHSGLLPFVKEVTELLFQEDLVKVIFVTETFAMGLNLPARAVVFSEFLKFDGETQRLITPGEFIQMAGRAGRRGKDVQGIVVAVFSDAEQLQQIADIMAGDAEPLDSAYRLGFGSILNFLSFQGLKPEEAVARSFRQFQRSFQLPKAAALNQSLQLQIRSLITKFNNENFKITLIDGQECASEKENLGVEQQNDIEIEQFGNYMLLTALHSARTAAVVCSQEFQEKAITRGRIVKFNVYEKKTDLIPRSVYGIVIGSARLGGGQYVDVLIPAATKPALSGAPSAQFAKPPMPDPSKKVQKLRSVFGTHLVDSLLPSFSMREVTGQVVEIIEENDNVNMSEITKSVNTIHFQKSKDQHVDIFKNQEEKQKLINILEEHDNKETKINDQEDENTIITDMSSFDMHRLNDILDDEFKIVSPTLLNALIVELGSICASSDYLKASKGAKKLMADWEAQDITVPMQSQNDDKQEQTDIQQPFGGANAKIIRLSVNQLTGISKSFLQQLPMSMDSADSRIQALQQLSTAIKLLVKAYIEKIVNDYPDLRGVGLIHNLLEHADDALRIRALYPCQNDAMSLIINNKLNKFFVTTTILYSGMLTRSLQGDFGKKGFKSGQVAWNQQVPQKREQFQVLFKDLVKAELFRRYLSGRLSAPAAVLSKELSAMEAVLIDMNYVDENRIVTQKGRFASKLNAVHELILAECLFNAGLQGINAVDLVTVVGLLLPEKTAQLQSAYSTEVEQLTQIVKESAERVWIACEKRGASNGTVPGAEPVQPVNGAIARQWASGDSLIQLCKQFKGLFEGTAVRLLKRLVTALQQLGEAAESWAQEDLKKVVEEAIRRVNRGIVKADSLYIVQEQDDM